MNTLTLTLVEQALFQKLPEKLRDGWIVEDQPVMAFETDEQLSVRANMMELDAFPELQEVIRAMREGKKLSLKHIKSIPEAALGEILFALGARGISVLMQHLLADAAEDKHLEAVAGFSQMRKDIIEANAAVPA